MSKVYGVILVTASIFVSGCGSSLCTVTISNPTDIDRFSEMVEIDCQHVAEKLRITEDDPFVVKDQHGRDVAYQVTHDDKLIFQVHMSASASLKYTISKGKPQSFDTLAFGKQYPERLDDFAWENDLVGFRAYGPALQKRKEKGYGYDLFAKRGTTSLVLKDFYNRAFGERTTAVYKELLKKDKALARNYKLDSMSFHIDRGFGMDAYAVGPTLGAGVTALVDEDIVFPWCYKEYEILDNGPLRTSFKLTFPPSTVGADSSVVETRIITLDVGSYLNRTIVTYGNISSSKVLVSGIVLRDKDGNECVDSRNCFIAYPAPSMNLDSRNPDVDNGTYFVGHVYPKPFKEAKTIYYPEQESKSLRGDAAGHVLVFYDYVPQDSFVYYWGFGWNHADMRTYEQWMNYLNIFSEMIRTPLKIRVR